MPLYIGFDPGLVGGAAMIETDPAIRVIDIIDLPTMGDGAARRINSAALRAWIRPNYPCDHVFVEIAGAMPAQGTVSAYRYGRAVGAIEAVIACCGLPMTHVAATSWKRHFNLRGPEKEPSRQMAIQLCPAAAQFVPLRKHHGRAEALLIAMYGAHILTKGK